MDENNKSSETFFQSCINNVLESDNPYLNSFYFSFLSSLKTCQSYTPEKLNKLITNNLNIKNNLNIINLNCRSLINKLDDIENLLNTINFELDILSLTETWLTQFNKKILQIFKTFTQSHATELTRKVEVLLFL